MELFLSTMSHIFPLLGHMQIFFLIMSRFWISVGGSLAFFCICPAFGFLWEVSSPFLHMSHLLIPPQNLYQMILICSSTYPVYKFPEQNPLIFLPFRII